jgi:hypothetical protein
MGSPLMISEGLKFAPSHVYREGMAPLDLNASLAIFRDATMSERDAKIRKQKYSCLLNPSTFKTKEPAFQHDE